MSDRAKIKGAKYKAVVLHVLEKDSFGRPRKVRCLYDEEKITLNGAEEFVIVYMPEQCVRPDVKGRA